MVSYETGELSDRDRLRMCMWSCFVDESRGCRLVVVNIEVGITLVY